MDCSSWKSSLQAYGIRMEETAPLDWQKWHLKWRRPVSLSNEHSHSLSKHGHNASQSRDEHIVISQGRYA